MHARTCLKSVGIAFVALFAVGNLGYGAGSTNANGGGGGPVAAKVSGAIAVGTAPKCNRRLP